MVSDGSGANFCQAAIGPLGEVYVSYQQQGDVYVARSTDNGATFSRTQVNGLPTQLGSMPGPLPYLSVDRLGRVDLVWSAATHGGGAANALQFGRSTDGGQTFRTEATVATSTGQLMFAFGLGHDRSGRVHVAFASDNASPGGTYQVFYTMGE